MSLQFAYWVPNVSGGLVISKLAQRTGWSFEDNARYAKLAEEAGFDYALLQTRFIASYGAENQLEAITLASALAAVTSKLKLIAAVLPGLWQPGPVAKVITTLDQISRGRAAVNIVSGWFKGEFHGFGEPWLDHNERYRRSEEFIRVLKQLWTQDETDFRGDFYRINGAPHKPKPYVVPPVFQGGNSAAAREMAARVSDWYFMNGNTVEGFRAQIEDVTRLAAAHGRKLKFGANAFVIVRDTEEEARQALRDIIAHADPEAVEGFRSQVQFAGQASPEREGMWANSNFDDLVQYNDGFKTGLIGTPAQVADKIMQLKSIGVDLVLAGFLHYEEDIQAFGEKVLPLVRAKEAELLEAASR
ncbi:dimethylsulfone monooxygenase SfnG [Paenibacillus xanthanilyticus]|uniref:Dimethylsulfone monooxygenase SfnG n=1 Tax=Paenibacillus xanthanilyticus TaxID=1783531 RepID=A0ABV8K693_9BACL